MSGPAGSSSSVDRPTTAPPAGPCARPRRVAAVLLLCGLLFGTIGLSACGRLRDRLHASDTSVPVATSAASAEAAPTTVAATNPTATTTAEQGAAVGAEQKQLARLDSSLRDLDSQLGEMDSQVARSHDTAEPDPAN